MTITVKSRTNVFIMLTPIYDELFPRKCPRKHD